MEKETKLTEATPEIEEPIEVPLFQVPECYVYLFMPHFELVVFTGKYAPEDPFHSSIIFPLIPPRKSAASYRADEWNVNKWAWEGTLKVLSKGEECIIKLEDKETGELYARAFLRDGEPHPVEPVIDSSRYFVLRIEENIGGRLRHAFIGIGFRERPEAYDFQAALHDHQKYLNKKKTAEEMEQQYQKSSSVDYSLKEGETLKLQIKNKTGGTIRSKFFEQGLNNLSLEEKANRKDSAILLKPPPPPPAPLSPVDTAARSPPVSPSKLSLEQSAETKDSVTAKEDPKKSESVKEQDPQDVADDDFGDFQAAG